VKKGAKQATGVLVFIVPELIKKQDVVGKSNGLLAPRSGSTEVGEDYQMSSSRAVTKFSIFSAPSLPLAFPRSEETGTEETKICHPVEH
jgi:hypothetical protein